MTFNEFKKAIETTIGYALESWATADTFSVVIRTSFGPLEVTATPDRFDIRLRFSREQNFPEGANPESGEWHIGLRTDGPEQADANLKTLARRLAQIGYAPPAAPEAPVKQGEPDAGLPRELRSYLENIVVTARVITGIRWGYDGDGGADAAAHSIIELAEAALKGVPEKPDAGLIDEVPSEWTKQLTPEKAVAVLFGQAPVETIPGSPDASGKFVVSDPVSGPYRVGFDHAATKSGLTDSYPDLVPVVNTKTGNVLGVVTALCASRFDAEHLVRILNQKSQVEPPPHWREEIREAVVSLRQLVKDVSDDAATENAVHAIIENLEELLAPRLKYSSEVTTPKDGGPIKWTYPKFKGEMFQGLAQRAYRKPTEWEILNPLDSMPSEIIEAARKLGDYAKMQNWGHEWVLGDVSSAYKPAAGLVFTENQKHILRDALNNYIVDRVTKGLGQSPACHNAKAILSKLQ